MCVCVVVKVSRERVDRKGESGLDGGEASRVFEGGRDGR